VKGYINKSWCGTHQPPNLETTCKGNSKPDLRVILKVYPDTFLWKMEKEVYVYIPVAEEEARWRVTGIIDMENAVAGDPLLDIAKTDYYAIKEHAAKREGFLAGYGRLPVNWRDRVQL
jgi:hypothetical protein